MTSAGAGKPLHTETAFDGRPRAPAETEHVPDLPRFGRYRTFARLGEGATGVVYRGEDESLGRPVAIKVLHDHSDPGIRERFLREARAFGAVQHPNILAIYDGGTQGELPYLVMELAAGGTLRDRIKAGPLSVEAVRRLGIQIGRALAVAHDAGILHRDIKPANILLVEEDRWKLADFGIARLPDSKLTVTGQFLGSPSYAAPESLRAGEFSPAADVYGLGATLYEALAGGPPYGDHDMSSLLRKLDHEAPPLHERCAVPRSIADAIMAAVALDPAARPTASGLADRLAAIEDEPLAVAAVALPPIPAAGAAMHGVGVVTGIGAATGVGAGTGVGFATATAMATATATTADGAAAAGQKRRSRKGLLIGLGIAAVLLIALLASGGGSGPAASARDSRLPSTSPLDRMRDQTAPGTESGEPAAGEPASGEPKPQYVDQDGNPVDEETARKLLDEERRAREEEPRGRGRGRGKKHRGGD